MIGICMVRSGNAFMERYNVLNTSEIGGGGGGCEMRTVTSHEYPRTLGVSVGYPARWCDRPHSAFSRVLMCPRIYGAMKLSKRLCDGIKYKRRHFG
jgi:hypothetical protein